MSNWHRKYTKRHLSYHRRKHHFYKRKYNLLKFFIFIILILFVYFNWGFISSNFQEGKKWFVNLYEENIKEEIKEINLIKPQNPERKEECKEAISYLNNIRKSKLEWDDGLYNLAVFRSKDMFDRNYFDHTTPEGTCAKDFQSQFNIPSKYILAENLGGMSYYSKGDVVGNCKETVDGWMISRGHKYNLLYDEHIKGAIGCYYEICVFYGMHTNPYGLGAGECTTGEEGLAFWDTAPKQEGEI